MGGRLCLECGRRGLLWLACDKNRGAAREFCRFSCRSGSACRCRPLYADLCQGGYWRMDDCAGRLDGKREPLDHRPIAVTWMLTFIVGAGHFSHCIASSAEIVVAILSGHLRFSNYFQWLLPATLGNILGGVAIVTLLNYAQVRIGATPELSK